MRWVWKEMEIGAEEAWSRIADTGYWPAWGPSVRAVDPTDTIVHEGMTGRVQTPVGIWIPFEILGVDPGHQWTWRVAGIPATDHRVDPIAPCRSRVGMGVPTPAAPYLLVCRLALGRIAAL